MNTKENITQALGWRYAVQVFDPTKKVSEDDVKTILESARLSPSSYGIEAWKFIVVENPEVRVKLKEVGYGQPKITDASHLVVLTYRTDVVENIVRERLERTAKIQNVRIEDLEGLKHSVEGAVTGVNAKGMLEAWVRSQTYIALGIMMETASLMGIDNAPMEGFQNEKVDEVLGLKVKNLKSATMLALGYRGDDPAGKRPKVRREFDEVVEYIK
ncbi:MAG: NAD(P)H-dependent oxidoreductase [bacterium]